MKTYNIVYSDKAALIAWINSIDFSHAKSVLVQLFSGIDDKEILKSRAPCKFKPTQVTNFPYLDFL